MSRLVSFNGMILGIILIVYIYYYRYDQSAWQTSAIEVDDANRVLLKISPEQEYDVSFRIHNRSSRTLRIVGRETT